MNADNFFARIDAVTEAVIWFHTTTQYLPPTSDSLLPVSSWVHLFEQVRPVPHGARVSLNFLRRWVRELYRPLARMQRVHRAFMCSPLMPSLADVMCYVRRQCAVFTPSIRQHFTYEIDRLLERTQDTVVLALAARCLFTENHKQFEFEPLCDDMDVSTTLSLTCLPSAIDVESIAQLARFRICSDMVMNVENTRLHVPIVLLDATRGPAEFTVRFLDELPRTLGFVSLSGLFNNCGGTQAVRIYDRGLDPKAAATWQRMAAHSKRTVARWADRVQRFRQDTSDLHSRSYALISAEKRPTESANFRHMVSYLQSRGVAHSLATSVVDARTRK